MEGGKFGHAHPKRLFLVFYISFVVNIPLSVYAWYKGAWPGTEETSGLPRNAALIVIPGISWVIWMAHQMLPREGDVFVSWCITVMEGSRSLCYAALYGFCTQSVIFLKLYPGLMDRLGDSRVLWINGTYAVAMLFIPPWNGMLHMLLISKRLRLRIRILMLLAMWISAANLLVPLHAMRLVHEEYGFECYKESVRRVRVESDLCSIRYPPLLVHGVGFRDLRYFNYWGRIPRELARYGASVYYGNQETFATTAWNAGDIRKKIERIVEGTGCGKVNIIAHSRGGLDSRFAVSKLGAAPMVAPLTTINTPHRGCRFVDYACRLPKGLYRTIARGFDYWSDRFGDPHPDLYTATHQFSTEFSRVLNEDVPDMPGIYYQSFTSLMKDFLSDPLSWFPYLLIQAIDGANDGLATPKSAMWGISGGLSPTKSTEAFPMAI